MSKDKGEQQALVYFLHFTTFSVPFPPCFELMLALSCERESTYLPL